MMKNCLLPIRYTGFDGSDEYVQYYDVVFNAEWGPYKQEQTVSCLVINFTTCEVYHVDDNGIESDRTNVQLAVA